MTSITIVLVLLAVLGLGIALIGLRVIKPTRKEEDEAIEAVRKLAQQELRDWARRHSKSQMPR